MSTDHRLRPLTLARFLSTAGRDRDSGLIALEWLLIVAAVAGLAASSTLVVQRAVDRSMDIPGDVHVRLIDADIAAAQIAGEATAWRRGFDGNELVDHLLRGVTNAYGTFQQRCSALGAAFEDVVESAVLVNPQETYTVAEVPWLQNLTEEERDEKAGEFVAAQCTVRPQAGLGG